ncbi:hypothetical protein [Microcoleus sp. OTE_8_concoct_300]|uniref:hypothetical protein n=1 Tax=Microcoleus sp. OTE_8_concoct_300 TaxID=2964710 RepID=UPI00403F5EF9
MSRVEGDVAGKNIITYDSIGGKEYSPNDIGQYLREFKLNDALRLIGELSYEIFKSNKGLHKIKNIPVFDGVLAYLSMRLIESSNDDPHSKDMTVDDLLKAIDMYFGLPDPFQKDSDNLQGFLIRFGASQLDYDREARHLLPRTLLIYENLWTKSGNCNQVDIANAIKSFSGLNLQETLVLSLAFSRRAKNGFFRLIEDLEQYPDTLKSYFDINKQKAFANWISCKYSDFRYLSISDMPPTIDYEKFRFNPLWLKPAIIPDCNPKPDSSQVYITPIPALIYRRVTTGLYFTLSDYFKENNKKPFRKTFGEVFQEYVGLLLKKAVGELNVQQEWRYVVKKDPKDTPDWFVIQNGTALLIEVKQSGLYLPAKTWGQLGDIKDDLKRNIGAGVHQMWKFEEDRRNGLCTVPDWLDGIEITERLVVTYDRPYFVNSSLRDEIRQQLYPTIPESFHWHSISVEELEYFLGIASINLMDALKEKRLDTEGDRMDFRDYYSRKSSQENCRNPYLDSVYDSFFGDLG